MFKKLRDVFKRDVSERSRKELLRENLGLMPIDIYYIDHPQVKLTGDDRIKYLKGFYDVVKNEHVMDTIKYLINKQATTALRSAGEGFDTRDASININGMATVRDEFIRLSQLYQKENNVSDIEFNKFSI